MTATTTDHARSPWAANLQGWDGAFAALTAVAAVSLLLADGNPTALSGWTVGALGVLVVAYLLAGRRGVRRGDLRLTRGYLLVMIPVVCLTTGVSTLGAITLFIGYLQIWLMSDSRREGIAWCVALTVALCVTVLCWPLATGDRLLLRVGADLGVGLLFALGLGLWVSRVSAEERRRAELLARLESAQDELAATHRTTGVLAERSRIAQEIHDTLAQGFTSVVMLAQTVQTQIDRGTVEQATDRLAQIEQVARDNLAEARSLVAAFGPAGLHDATLAEAVTRMSGQFESETGVRVAARVDPAVPVLPPDTQVVLLRAAQEALSNVRKHAQATRVAITLDLAGAGAVRLAVRDDGRGLATAAEGVGLSGMRVRVTGAGGQVEVTGTAGAGTTVLVQVPTRGLELGPDPAPAATDLAAGGRDAGGRA